MQLAGNSKGCWCLSHVGREGSAEGGRSTPKRDSCERDGAGERRVEQRGQRNCVGDCRIIDHQSQAHRTFAGSSTTKRGYEGRPRNLAEPGPSSPPDAQHGPTTIAQTPSRSSPDAAPAETVTATVSDSEQATPRQPAAGDDTQSAQSERTSSEDAPADRQQLTEEIQRDLKALGYEPGPIDGIYGPKTKRAIEAFERDMGMKPKGDATVEIWQRLRQAGSLPDRPTPPGRCGRNRRRSRSGPSSTHEQWRPVRRRRAVRPSPRL